MCFSVLKQCHIQNDQILSPFVSWRFTPSDFIFQTEFPLKEDFDAKINHNVCSEKLYQVNLIAIKVGDVDGDAFTDAN